MPPAATGTILKPAFRRKSVSQPSFRLIIPGGGEGKVEEEEEEKRTMRRGSRKE